ncbi:GumC family protein [Gracilimonas mengyeensis]|uniref:non-specific protein-tyrosine kinase n=1 Tax=Gracilimonas mengyeensis TaxID=1302730 RepID=A0A521C203_9BACT|nr:polysaccharide biosynthesis tyrosine autokinase [Gracilimonas mengyeensis]SMO52760.1 capsular exopolysaccharide family [Gracilimonas mengyeensis]
MSSFSNNHHHPYGNGQNGFHANGNGSLGTFGNNSFGNNTEDDDEIDLFKLFGTLLRNKWTLILFVGVFSVLAAILAISQIPIYKSDGTLFISESKNRYSYAGSDLSNLLTTTYGIGVGSTIANELQIIKSRTLSEDVADSLMSKELSEAGFKYPVLWRAYPEDSTTTSIDTVAQRIRDNLSAVQVDQETDIVRIGFESPLPEEAAFVTNLVMDTYSQLSTEQNRAMATSALSFLRGERENIEDQLEQTENELEQFMDESMLIATDAQTQQLINTITTLETKKQEIRVQYVAVNSAIETYESQLDEIKPGLADQFSESVTPRLTNFQFALAELETEKLLLLANNPELEDNPDHPELKKIDQQINRVQSQIRSIAENLIDSKSSLALSFLGSETGNIGQKIIDINEKLIQLRVERSQYETQIEALDERIASFNERFEELPEDIIELARLKRDVKINEELYLLVSNQFAEMNLWERTQFGLGRPLDYAVVPKNPIKPQKKLWVLIGFLLGGILGAGFIFIREALDDSIKSSDFLKKYNVPFLGNIPDFKIIDSLDPDGKQLIQGKSVSNQLLTFLDHISPISEAYRRLRINTVYSDPDKDYKVLMVSSSAKGEGKSTIAANLAVTFAEAEKSVLVVDLDLRRPTMHKVFGENREPGLVELLFETAGFDNCIKETIAPNVDVICAGKKTPEPASVLDSQRLKTVIDKLKDKYDHIILDTAPYGIISDSASLLRLTDGIIVVARFGLTSKKELDFTLDGLKHLNANIVGLVLNAFDPKRSSDYYTNYYYYKRAYKDYYEEEKAAL